MLQTSVNQSVNASKMPVGALPTGKPSDMVTINVRVPRGALDLLGFRYYELDIVENDIRLVETAVEEIVQQQLLKEYGLWHLRNTNKLQIENDKI